MTDLSWDARALLLRVSQILLALAAGVPHVWLAMAAGDRRVLQKRRRSTAKRGNSSGEVVHMQDSGTAWPKTSRLRCGDGPSPIPHLRRFGGSDVNRPRRWIHRQECPYRRIGRGDPKAAGRRPGAAGGCPGHGGGSARERAAHLWIRGQAPPNLAAPRASHAPCPLPPRRRHRGCGPSGVRCPCRRPVAGSGPDRCAVAWPAVPTCS